MVMNEKNGMFKRSNSMVTKNQRNLWLNHSGTWSFWPADSIQPPRIPGQIHSNSQNKAQNQNGMVYIKTKKNTSLKCMISTLSNQFEALCGSQVIGYIYPYQLFSKKTSHVADMHQWVLYLQMFNS